MNVERAIRIMAGSFILVSLALGVEASRATTCEEFATQYSSALKQRGPRLIEAMI